MLRTGNVVVLMFAALCCSAPALAADGDDHGLGLSVGVTGGTYGLGLEAGYRFNGRFGVRANAASYDDDETTTSSGFDIDGKAKLESLGAAVDFYPFGGSFRVSLGLRSNKNRFSGLGTPAGATVDVGGDTYTAAEVGVLTGSADFKKTAPTLTVGWGGKFRTGVHFGVDLGLMAQGSPRLAAASSGTLASNPTFQSSLDDQLAEWQDDVKDYKYWPVIQMHLLYRF
jgi:hypothetical protein